MPVDKNYCMSSFLAYRYIIDGEKNFSTDLHHEHFVQMRDENKFFVDTSDEIDNVIQSQFDKLKTKKLGLFLSGGMDSAILAAYMPGQDAYTFRFLGGDFQIDELKRAEKFAQYYNLNLHYVDVDWNLVEEYVDVVMKHKQAPVHSIEPQVCAAALQAQKDNVEVVVIGDGSDYVFGGMDKLLSRDWNYQEFINRFIYVNPYQVLKNPVNIFDVFEKYRLHDDKIDFLGVMDSITIDESYSSYKNAFDTLNMPYVDPYECMKMKSPLNLQRVRNGDSKYLIRELYKKKYPTFSIPEKNPMPRPVDMYFADWKGPVRSEFIENLDMSKFSGNQKWLLWVLERFLNKFV